MAWAGDIDQNANKRVATERHLLGNISARAVAFARSTRSPCSPTQRGLRGSALQDIAAGRVRRSSWASLGRHRVERARPWTTPAAWTWRSVRRPVPRTASRRARRRARPPQRRVVPARGVQVAAASPPIARLLVRASRISVFSPRPPCDPRHLTLTAADRARLSPETVRARATRVDRVGNVAAAGLGGPRAAELRDPVRLQLRRGRPHAADVDSLFGPPPWPARIAIDRIHRAPSSTRRTASPMTTTSAAAAERAVSRARRHAGDRRGASAPGRRRERLVSTHWGGGAARVAGTPT